MSDEKVTITLIGGPRDGDERTLPGPPQEFLFLADLLDLDGEGYARKHRYRRDGETLTYRHEWAEERP